MGEHITRRVFLNRGLHAAAGVALAEVAAIPIVEHIFGLNVHARAKAAEAKRRIYLLGGKDDGDDPVWFQADREFFGEQGIDLQMIKRTPKLNIRVDNEDARRAELFGRISSVMFADSEPKSLYGVSANGGAVQMYMDHLRKQGLQLTTSQGNLIIDELGIIHARDLFSKELSNFLLRRTKCNNPLLNEEFDAIPEALLGFYLPLGQETIDFIANQNIWVKSGYGTRDSNVPPHNGIDLARRFGVAPRGFTVEHMGIVTTPKLLHQFATG